MLCFSHSLLSKFFNYNTFYLLAIASAIVILLLEGRKRKLPAVPWILVVSTGIFFFVIGCKAILFSKADWMAALYPNGPLHFNGLSLFGGILFSVPAIWISAKILKLNNRILDAYALVLPVGMIFQRIGCFVAGCCYGKPTFASWGISYPEHSAIFHYHESISLIPPGAIESAPVHPVQLYELFLCLLAVAFLLTVRKHFRAHGNLFLLSGALYYLVRFITEFFRDPSAHTLGGSVYGPLNYTQWGMLVLIAASFFIIIARERKFHSSEEKPNPPGWRLGYLIYLFILVALLNLTWFWFDLIEILVIGLVLSLATIVAVLWTYKVIVVPALQYTFAVIIIMAMITMAQTYPERLDSDDERLSYNTFGLGFLAGTQNLTYVPKDCDGNPIYGQQENYKNNYILGGAGFSRSTQTARRQSLTWGINGYLGQNDERMSGPNITNNPPPQQIFGINPFVQYDWKIVGLGLGYHFGNLVMIGDGSDYLSSTQKLNAFPQSYLRIGNLKSAFFETSVGNQFPSSFPGNQFQIGMGINLGKDSFLRFGTSTSTGFYAGSIIKAGDKFLIEPYLGFMGSMFNSYEKEENFIGSINLRYRFNKVVNTSPGK